MKFDAVPVAKPVVIHVVVMGVAGCRKSAVGQRIAAHQVAGISGHVHQNTQLSITASFRKKSTH